MLHMLEPKDRVNTCDQLGSKVDSNAKEMKDSKEKEKKINIGTSFR